MRKRWKKIYKGLPAPYNPRQGISSLNPEQKLRFCRLTVKTNEEVSDKQGDI